MTENAGALDMPAVRTPHDQRYLCQGCDSLIRTDNPLPFLHCAGIPATLNQDRTAIDHNGLTRTESFLHQKQKGLCNVMSLTDSAHRETLSHTFKELLPFC